MFSADLSPARPRRIHPEMSITHTESARTLIPDVATALTPRDESIALTMSGINDYFSRWEKSVKDLLSSHLARKNFHIPFPQLDQERLHDTLELATLHQQQLFEALLDPTGEKAKAFRPTHEEIELVTSLVNPKLPENANAITSLGIAFERYAPKHNENFMILAPTLLLELLGAAEYQKRAPYAGKVGKLTSEFYNHYFKSVPPELATNNNPEIYRQQALIETFSRLVHFNNFNIAFYGVGNGNEQLIDEYIKSWRELPNVTRMFSKANRKIKRIGFDILDKSDVAPWLDKYHQLSLDQIYLRPELKGIASQLFSFGSVYMDIIENVKNIQALLGASHILKRNGRFSDDQTLPATYSNEIEFHHNVYPEDPYGMFWRDWRTGETKPPSKLFYAKPLAERYFFYYLAGFNPESFQYGDAMHLEHLIRENPQQLSASESTLRSRPWLKKAFDTYYQTIDAYGRVSHRTIVTLTKTRKPMPILPLITNFLARSPAFAPKPEQ